MSFPIFYIPDYQGEQEFVLDEDNSRHVVQVLRMQPGEVLQLTDGKGLVLTVSILDGHKKRCRVRVAGREKRSRPGKNIFIAISLLKNASRFEWFLEKATEIGVSGIIPLLCDRTEKQHFRQDRMKSILISGMLQSQQAWLPGLSEPTPFKDMMSSGAFPMPSDLTGSAPQKFIAHCLEEKRLSLSAIRHGAKTGDSPEKSEAQGGSGEETALILIGPEGDFSKREIDEALSHRFIPVTLGETRLRTETAGIVAATLLCI